MYTKSSFLYGHFQFSRESGGLEKLLGFFSNQICMQIQPIEMPVEEGIWYQKKRSRQIV